MVALFKEIFQFFSDIENSGDFRVRVGIPAAGFATSNHIRAPGLQQAMVLGL